VRACARARVCERERERNLQPRCPWGNVLTKSLILSFPPCKRTRPYNSFLTIAEIVGTWRWPYRNIKRDKSFHLSGNRKNATDLNAFIVLTLFRH